MYSTMSEIAAQSRNFNTHKMLESDMLPDAAMDEEEEEDDNQLVKLCLKKPDNWNWELTTSKSSNCISFPMIQLYNEKMELLVEATEADMCIKSVDIQRLSRSRSSASVSTRKLSRSSNRSTDNIKLLDSFKISLKEESPKPVEVFSERGLLVRDLNSKEFKKGRENSKPPSSFNSNDSRTSKMEKIPEKETKTYQRSSSMKNAQSILGRISELKRDSSSSEEEGKLKTLRQKYTFRTCNIGTIIVPKDSFSKVPKERRRKKQSYRQSISGRLISDDPVENENGNYERENGTNGKVRKSRSYSFDFDKLKEIMKMQNGNSNEVEENLEVNGGE